MNETIGADAGVAPLGALSCQQVSEPLTPSGGNIAITGPLGQCYDQNEILAGINGFSEEEIKRIQSLARFRFRLMGQAGRAGHVEVEDLFIEAAIRTIERKRRWKRGVTAFNHFLAVMRSIAHQRFKQAGRFTSLNELIAESENTSSSASDAQASVARLREQLRGDAIALNILESMMDEMPARNTQRFLGITAEIYWAARKRIRRAARNLRGPAHRQPRGTATRSFR